MRAKSIAKGIATAFLGASLLSGQALALEKLRIPVALTSATSALVEQITRVGGRTSATTPRSTRSRAVRTPP